MRRFVVLGLVGALAFSFVGSPASRAATIASSWPVGRGPFGLAFDSTTGKVYVANSLTTMLDGTGRISVVDPATGSVGGLATSLTANFVVADASGRRLYSSNTDPSGTSASVDVFDLDSGTRVSIPGVGGLGLALDAAAGRLFAGGHELSIIDTTTNARVGTPLAAAGAWFGVAVDAGSKRLYLADGNESAPRLFVYDYDSQDVLTAATPPTVALGTAIRFGLAVDPVRHLVFAAGSDTTGGSASAFYVIDPDALQVVHTTALDGFPSGIALAPGGDRIYVSVKTSETSGGVYVLDGATFAVTEVIQLSALAPGLPLLHSDGRLYIGDYNRMRQSDSTLVALDLTPRVSLELSNLAPRTNENLVATVVVDDPNSAGYRCVLAYSVNNVLLFEVPMCRYTYSLSVHDYGDKDDVISIRATVTDQLGGWQTVATATAVVADSAPGIEGLALDDTTPTSRDVLVATVSPYDVDGDVITLTYEWTVNGVSRRISTSSASTDTFDLGPKGNGDNGDVITVSVVASAGTLTSSTWSASATVTPGRKR
jgi:DNA-binding beta-propeller fold protein YncE